MAYSLNAGDATCLSAVHIPAIVLLCGPPWQPGNTALLTRSSRSVGSLVPTYIILFDGRDEQRHTNLNLAEEDEQP